MAIIIRTSFCRHPLVHNSLTMILLILTIFSSGSFSATRRFFLEPVTLAVFSHEVFSNCSF